MKGTTMIRHIFNAGCMILTIGACAHAFEVRNLRQYADPTSTWGNTFVGPAVPFGSIHPSPEGNMGFGLNRPWGAGVGEPYHVLIAPRIGFGATASATLSNEVIRCGYYKADCASYNITTEVVPSHFSSIFKFRYPASSNSHIVINCDNANPDFGVKVGQISVDPATKKISGGGTYNSGWVGIHKMYFCAKFSKEISGFGTWKGGTASSGSTSVSTTSSGGIGAYFKFSTTADEVVYLKVAVSLVSTQRAEALLDAEIPAWDFNAVQSACEAKWDSALSTILIDDSTMTTNQLKMFYTNLYRSMIMPRDRTGDCPFGSTGPFLDMHFCGWDTFRTLFPLLTLIRESFAAKNINSFIERFNYTGRYLSDAYAYGVDGGTQGGDDIDPTIADGYVKGVSGVNWEDAYKILKYNADNARRPEYRQNDRGWIPWNLSNDVPVSRTMEYANNDFNAALVAKGLGKTTDYNRYLTRSGKWENLWNPNKSNGGFSGFLQPRNSDSTWYDWDVTDRTAWGKPCYEGKLWEYSYSVPHNVDRLVTLMGGTTTFVNRLTYYYNNGLQEWSNEPTFLVSRLFNYVSRPDLTATWARFGLNKYTLKGPPGDEDSGAMGSFYVFSILGFFPVVGQDVYLINGPRYKKMTIQMENGKNIVINGPNAIDSTKMFVQAISFNNNGTNVNYKKSWLSHSDIKNGATITFVMGTSASATWGKATADLPPSTPAAILNLGSTKTIETGSTVKKKIGPFRVLGISGIVLGLHQGVDCVVTMTNSKGQMLLRRNSFGKESMTISSKGLSKGLYVVTVKGLTESYSKNFVMVER